MAVVATLETRSALPRHSAAWRGSQLGATNALRDLTSHPGGTDAIFMSVFDCTTTPVARRSAAWRGSQTEATAMLRERNAMPLTVAIGEAMRAVWPTTVRRIVLANIRRFGRPGQGGGCGWTMPTPHVTDGYAETKEDYIKQALLHSHRVSVCLGTPRFGAYGTHSLDLLRPSHKTRDCLSYCVCAGFCLHTTTVSL